MAFLHLSVISYLRGVEGAGPDTISTADALVLVYCDDAILHTLSDRLHRTSVTTGRIPAMHTGQRDIDLLDIGKFPRPHFNYRSPARSNFYVVPELAGNLAGMALDAPLFIEVKPVLWHFLILLLLVFFNWPR
jgi:hypothetical protein